MRIDRFRRCRGRVAVARHNPDRIVVTMLGEWRVLDAMRGWQKRLRLTVEILADDRFICSSE